MGLSKKTFLYSIILAVAMTAFITGYFVFMLPSLYVNYVMRSNLDSVEEIHRGYAREKSYQNLTVKNPSSTYSLEIPRTGNNIFVSGKFFRLTVDVHDEELQEYLNQIKNMLGHLEDTGSAEVSSASENPADSEILRREDFAALWDLLTEKLAGSAFSAMDDYPLAFELEQNGSQGAYREEYSRTHMTADGFAVFEAGVSDNDYSYTTYVAFSVATDAFLFTIFPTMTPQMEEIRPIVAESMPMIVAVVFLLVLLSSRFFAGRIVNPIIRLAGQAETITGIPENTASVSVKNTEHLKTDFPGTHTFDLDRKDEIGALGKALSDLYERLRQSYLALAEKNRILEEENKRQEVFLRATSHQLKTPITAALLLVDGMRNRIGKYKDTDAWLPEVKKQLLSMRKIVDDVIYLNYHTGQLQPEPAALELLLEELLKLYQVQSEAKNLEVLLTGKGTVSADREILKKILDNLLSNAVQYTPCGGQIEIRIKKIVKGAAESTELSITNYGVTIDEELLSDIFEPFVTSSEKGTGKGLGLYIAAYYSRLSGMRLAIKNGENCVRSLLECPEATVENRKGERQCY